MKVNNGLEMFARCNWLPIDEMRRTNVYNALNFAELSTSQSNP